jgi:hypothetical protein
MINDRFYGRPKAQEAYQPIGDLLLTFGSTNFTDYRRELDMETGVAKVSYRSGDAVITREAFVSWPDRVLVMRIARIGQPRVPWGPVSPDLSGKPISPQPALSWTAWKGPFSAARRYGRPDCADCGELRYRRLTRGRGGRSEAAGSI